jgi:hypothetical protein
LLICKTAISYDFIEKRFVKIHTKMVFFPKLSELNFFNGLYHYENFGVFKFTTFTSTEKLSVLKKIVNFFSFISNPHKYLRESFWIPLTLHNLGLSFLMFPYWIYVNRKMGNRGEIK